MSRSLKVDRQYIQTVKLSLKRSGFISQRALAEDLGMALSTISRFLNGKPVDYAIFLEICDRVNLDWQSIAALAPTEFPGAPQRTDSVLPQALNRASAPDSAPKQTESRPESRQDWGEAIDTDFFHGRSAELATLKQTILTEQCRLIAILGIGGIGKTSLAAKLAQTIAPEFEAVIWRSVRNAPSARNATPGSDSISLSAAGYGTDAGQTPALVTHPSLPDYLRQCRNPLRQWFNPVSIRQAMKATATSFDRLGKLEHQSCLLVTGREKPTDIGILESDRLTTRSLQLRGSLEAAQAIIQAKGLTGSPEAIQQLSQRYNANPLALKIVGASIKTLFEGKIALFLQAEAPIFNDFRRLLDQQFERLSHPEQTIFYWLAINREWKTASELTADIWPTISRADVFEALESLSWRALIETRSGQYTQQPVIMEYVTDRLVQSVYRELEYLGQRAEEPTQLLTTTSFLFCTHALLKATDKDYIRESQRRMILIPIAECIQITLIQPQIVSHFQAILHRLRQVIAGYGVGNFINLCRQLHIDLKGYDFSGLAVWQANLLEINLSNVNFVQADFRNCQFNNPFGSILSLALSPDEKLLAMGDFHSNIHIWLADNHQHLCTLSGHTDAVFSVAFSPDSQYLISGSGDTTLKLWQLKDYQCIKTLNGHHQAVLSVAFSPDGQWLASGGSDRTIKLWDYKSGQCLRSLEGHTGAVRSITFSGMGQVIVSGGFDHTLRLWDVQSGQCLKTLEGHTQGIWMVAFSPDSRLLISGGADKTVRMWDVNTGHCLKVLSGHQSAVWSVTFSPDGKRIASGGGIGVIKLWNTQSGDCERSFIGHTGWIWALVFSKKGQSLYSGSHDRTVRIWDSQNGYCLRTLSGYTNSIRTLEFSVDGRTLVTGSYDGYIRFWDVRQRQCVKVISHDSPVLDVSLSPDGKRLASSGGDHAATLKIWTLSNNALLKNLVGAITKSQVEIAGFPSIRKGRTHK